MYAETPPKAFGVSDTVFRVFILMASRRLKSDASRGGLAQATAQSWRDSRLIALVRAAAFLSCDFRNSINSRSRMPRASAS